MDSKDRFSDARVPELMKKARMGWWEADFKRQCYVCSEFIRDLFGLGEDGVISFKCTRWKFTVKLSGFGLNCVPRRWMKRES